MSSEIVSVGFEFEGIQISAFVDEMGRDWFRGSEVCQILKIANPATVIKREASKYWKEIQVGVGRPALYVSEPGLYSLIFASKQPIAEKFKEWVFEEVLPKLRTDGGYIMPNATSEQLRALTGKLEYLERRTKHRTLRSICKEVAQYNLPKKATREERNQFFLKLYWGILNEGKLHQSAYTTPSQFEEVCSAELNLPWRKS